MWTRKFWKDASERAVRTAAGVAVATLGSGLLVTDWVTALSTTGMAVVASLLASLASQLPNPDGSASFVPPGGGS
ncbi:holin [Amycolatopsis solani]|uniref:holin n=1 Tax=Amycolatopsis solani TaxID=3028615 RepID=UPI0025B23CD1|nr:holin [Amycolatopsis sp. MEP2-6]